MSYMKSNNTSDNCDVESDTSPVVSSISSDSEDSVRNNHNLSNNFKCTETPSTYIGSVSIQNAPNAIFGTVFNGSVNIRRLVDIDKMKQVKVNRSSHNCGNSSKPRASGNPVPSDTSKIYRFCLSRSFLILVY